ncbi:ABC transporter permease [Streptomyces sp. MST-110588]|uniref:ABC transporter permease n=1 Tax=Streptomyces sp. MST-110588 TaxID=2833628 RepID=UPI001F5DF096|nr:ABC transporter permease [Streptomyces sp. MST-110588]UNO43997.1 ABC transporter permease [Streptomyces sp. MST-110588]
MTKNGPGAGPVRGPGRVSPFAAVLKAEARLFAREPGGVFWVLVFPALLLTILGLIPSFREPDPANGGLRVIDLYVAVAVLVAVIITGLQVMPGTLAGYRERGVLRRMSTTPVRPAVLLTAQIVLHSAVCLGSVVLALAVGRLGFAVRLPEQPVGFAVTLLLTMLGALAFGCVICALSRTVKAAGAIGSAAFFPMMFTSGLWLPVQSMPEILQRIVQYTPFGAASQAMAQATGGHWPDWSHLGVLALWTALLIGAAARWFRWE